MSSDVVVLWCWWTRATKDWWGLSIQLHPIEAFSVMINQLGDWTMRLMNSTFVFLSIKRSLGISGIHLAQNWDFVLFVVMDKWIKIRQNCDFKRKQSHFVIYSTTCNVYIHRTSSEGQSSLCCASISTRHFRLSWNAI